MSDRWLVVGGGFRGIVGAYLLAKRGCEVVLIERGKQLGGVLYSAEWNGYYLDKGCHLFDNDSDAETAIVLELLNHDYTPVEVVYASITNGFKTDGIAIPDLRTFGKESVRDMVYEVARAAGQDRGDAAANLQVILDRRFGPTGSGLLAVAARKMYQTDLAELDADGFRLSPFDRVMVADDATARVLKEGAALDARIAASSQDDPLRYYRSQAREHAFRNFYPAQSGMRGFCESASRCLDERGVRVLLESGLETLEFQGGARAVLSNGESLEADHVLWAAGIEPMAQFLGLGEMVDEHIHRVPMVIYYFMFDKALEGPYTYQRNYDPNDLFFTASLPGSYGPRTCPEGRNYACCEIPTTFDSPQWEDPDAHADRVWEELVRYGLVTGGRPDHSLSFTVPVTYKMPKVGFGQLVDAIRQKISREAPILGIEDWEFSKTDIIRDIEAILGESGGA